VRIHWQASEARSQFSRLVQRALDEGPQVVTWRGEEVVVVLAVSEYRRLTSAKPDLRDYLWSGPDFSALELDRDRDLPREIEL
jgi:antitoxin Phd